MCVFCVCVHACVCCDEMCCYECCYGIISLTQGDNVGDSVHLIAYVAKSYVYARETSLRVGQHRAVSFWA